MPDLELIVWEDAHSMDPWSGAEELELSRLAVTSVGFCVKENEYSVALSGNQDDNNDQICCTIMIPKGAIKLRKILLTNEQITEAKTTNPRGRSRTIRTRKRNKTPVPKRR